MIYTIVRSHGTPRNRSDEYDGCEGQDFRGLGGRRRDVLDIASTVTEHDYECDGVGKPCDLFVSARINE